MHLRCDRDHRFRACLFSIISRRSYHGSWKNNATMHFGVVPLPTSSRGCIPKMVLLQLVKRWEFRVMRASKGEARYERSAKKEKERAAVASAVTAVTAVILLYAGNKCASLTHASAIAFTI